MRLLATLEDQLAEGKVQSDDEEEAANRRHVNSPPQQRSSEEVKKHRVDRYPHRLWCQRCAQGRGAGRFHSAGGHQSSVAIFAVDFFFMHPRA